ncbi:hypothetical protein [Streptomyces fulvorobeus]|uniref:Lipoprotein n=1 Tax=Streptomyces fulvorobeus TaxID=284028 RepID=A0A7J0CBT2_9ACTN|nr:hypothetical protein [Streptomyces fulvorobeus]NYE43486.1 hypothetical protein [Streptomyces fulvorobeus]GFM99959.1 hypothetical protein Sfulv_47700 [Streptomyces fulvorobeus]
MKHPFLAGAAVVVLTAALAACGSSAEGNGPEAGGAKTPPASGPPVAGPSAGATGEPAPGASASRTGGTGGTDETPKVPADRITPATGSFTKKQKEFLVDRVPEGMDPAAVLQTGQETCDKLRYLVKVDRDTAVGSIVTGEIPDARPAVSHLCTRYQELVDEAALGYGDGTHTGGKLRPGGYRSAAPTKDCTWQIEDGAGKVLDAGASGTGKPTRITVPRTARAFTSTGCYAWLPEGDNG